MAATGHIVGLDPMTDRIVVLRKGMDGRATRQVDVLTGDEGQALVRGLEDALYAQRLARQGKPTPDDVPLTSAAPEPEQTMLDLDSLTREEHP